MPSKLLINATRQETRVAVIEDGRLAELYIERPKERGIVGNIYKGKVVRVLPGMQASFVDIGLERAAFLYVTDFFEEYQDAFNQKEVEEERRRGRSTSKTQIQDLLSPGQEILVQVAKDPIGTKGARLTSHVSLAGRHLVYMPTVNHIGVSRKIDQEEERRRLKDLVRKTQTLEGGFIVRTAASGESDKSIQTDIQNLEKLWTKVLRRRQGVKAPALVHEELNLVQRTVRDFFTDDVDELMVDNRTAFRHVQQYISQYLPKKKRKVTLFKGKGLMFEEENIEPQIDRALARKVWLKSGGSLIIDQTEALTSVDVNTGRFVGTKNLEETILKTNLEAVAEIVSQLRVRNIGGLIIIDTIDMERKSNREKVYRALERALDNDKAKTNVLQISELGLVEMTRKRTRESLAKLICEPCAHCDGKGFHRSRRTVANEILRKLESDLHHKKGRSRGIEIVAHPNVVDILKTELYEEITLLEDKFGRKIVVRSQESPHPEHFDIHFTGVPFQEDEEFSSSQEESSFREEE